LHLIFGNFDFLFVTLILRVIEVGIYNVYLLLCGRYRGVRGV
jgi:hypothetical protein